MKKYFWTILLGIFLILSLSYITYEKLYLDQKNINPSKTNQETSNNTYRDSYQEMKGLYRYETNLGDRSDKEETVTYNLYLYENGTFIYEVRSMTGTGTIGNYIIKNNVIILNNLFATNSSTDLSFAEGTNSFTINKNTLTGSDLKNLENHIVLTKTSSIETQKFLTNHEDVTKILKRYLQENETARRTS